MTKTTTVVISILFASGCIGPNAGPDPIPVSGNDLGIAAIQIDQSAIVPM